MKEKQKSTGKDIAILLSVWGPLLFMLIGGVTYLNDGFDGTFMERLFPAIFLGFVCAFVSIIIVSNLFKNSERLWLVSGIVTFAGTIAAYLLDVTNFIVVELIIISCSVCLLVLIKTIMEKLDK